MITGRLFPYLLLVIAVLCGGLYFMYTLWDAADDRADRAEDIIVKERANVRVVEKFTEVRVEVVRRVPVIRERLVRLCDGGSANPEHPDEAAGTETGDVRAGRLHRLGAELADGLSETEQLIAIQQAAINAGCAEPYKP